MRVLELRVPPLAFVIALALMAAAIAWLSPALSFSWRFRIPVAIALFVCGLTFVVLGVTSFKRAQTTVNPMKPESSAKLVTSGVYRWTRNPMYVGMALLLAAWATYLSNFGGLALVVFFVGYIDRFQIRPEERVLRAKFGSEFEEYCGRVRRWI